MRQVECGVRRRRGWFLPGVELQVRDNVAGLRGSPLSSPGPSTGVSMQQEWELFQNCNKKKKKKKKTQQHSAAERPDAAAGPEQGNTMNSHIHTWRVLYRYL